MILDISPQRKPFKQQLEAAGYAFPAPRGNTPLEWVLLNVSEQLLRGFDDLNAQIKAFRP